LVDDDAEPPPETDETQADEAQTEEAQAEEATIGAAAE
jgi:hypothetical protein